jgi:protein disulfide-isomerase A1
MRNIQISILSLTIMFFCFNNIIAFKEWWEDSKILELNNENFLDHVGKDKYVVVKFYTRWCGYCRIMSPEYDKFQEVLLKERKDVLVTRLEGSINEDISMLYEISSYPRIALFEPGSTEIKLFFRGNRVATVMEKWIKVNAPVKTKVDGEKKIEKKPAEEKSNDSTKVTNEMEYFLKEINDIKNKMVNMEQDIISLKDINKKLNKEIEESKFNNKDEIISTENDSELNEEIKIDMKTLNEKKIKGIFDKYSIGDVFLFLCILLFMVGAVITFRNIFFTNNKSIAAADHPKV